MDYQEANKRVAGCPFCGQQPDVGQWTHGHLIACVGDVDDTCKIAPQLFGHDLDVMISDWNRRP